MSKYALTFYDPNHGTLDSVDTLIVECDTNPLDIPTDVLAKEIAHSAVYEGLYSEEDLQEILSNSDAWLILRNCDDVDVKIGGNEDA